MEITGEEATCKTFHLYGLDALRFLSSIISKLDTLAHAKAGTNNHNHKIRRSGRAVCNIYPEINWCNAVDENRQG